MTDTLQLSTAAVPEVPQPSFKTEAGKAFYKEMGNWRVDRANPASPLLGDIRDILVHGFEDQVEAFIKSCGPLEKPASDHFRSLIKTSPAHIMYDRLMGNPTLIAYHKSPYTRKEAAQLLLGSAIKRAVSTAQLMNAFNCALERDEFDHPEKPPAQGRNLFG